MRKPSMPRSIHQFIMAYTAWRTSGFSQFRSGCFWSTVQEVFAAPLVILPGGAAEVGAPAVRFGAGRAGLVALTRGTPDVPVGVRVVLIARSLEPGVLVGGVVDHQIHDDLQAALVGLGQHLVHIGERAEHRIDVLIVGDVIAVVVLRGLEHRGQPQHVHAQTGQIVQTGGDALDVAHAVVVRVLEAARIDLVDDRVRPPGVRGRAVRTHRIGQCGTLRSGHGILPFLPAVPPRTCCARRPCGRRLGLAAAPLRHRLIPAALPRTTVVLHTLTFRTSGIALPVSTIFNRPSIPRFHTIFRRTTPFRHALESCNLWSSHSHFEYAYTPSRPAPARL